MKLDAQKFALAGGLLWGACMFLCTWLALWSGYSMDFLNLMGSIYPGYMVTAGGSVVGLVYGFFDGYIGGWLFAKLYNWLLG
ncbi:MAG: bacteriophage holin [Patescibacteria group bacterium]|nr:bacteriophage holin [Patescibacteria group bacterium]